MYDPCQQPVTYREERQHRCRCAGVSKALSAGQKRNGPKLQGDHGKEAYEEARSDCIHALFSYPRSNSTPIGERKQSWPLLGYCWGARNLQSSENLVQGLEALLIQEVLC